MSFRTRFILLAVFNCSEIILSLWLLKSRFNLDLSQRLIDLDLNTPHGFQLLLGFMAIGLIGFLVNFLLLSYRRSEFTYDQAISVLKAAARS